MFAFLRGAARAAAYTYPLSHFRSLEERVGVIGFTMMLLIAMPHSLWAHEFKLGSIELDHPSPRATRDGTKVAAGYAMTGNTGSHTGHGG